MWTVCLSTLLLAEPVLIDRIIAVVNDDVITQSELEAAGGDLSQVDADTRARIKKQTLDQLIADRLLNQEIRESKIDVTDEDIDRAIEDIARQNRMSREDFDEAIASRGMNMAQYRVDLGRQLQRVKLIDLKVRSRVSFSEGDLRAEYERRTAAEGREELLVLSHVYVRYAEGADAAEKARALEKAKKARARLVEGKEDFAKVARELSDGPTRDAGGDLGDVSHTDLLPEMARELRTMEPGQISPPIETPAGVHVVLLRERKKKAAAGFESMRNAIYQELYQAEVERQMNLWVEELRARAAVELR